MSLSNDSIDVGNVAVWISAMLVSLLSFLMCVCMCVCMCVYVCVCVYLVCESVVIMLSSSSSSSSSSFSTLHNLLYCSFTMISLMWLTKTIFKKPKLEMVAIARQVEG